MIRGLVSVVTGPPTPQFFSEEPLQAEEERNGATVVETAVAWVIAALLFNRLKIWTSGSNTTRSLTWNARLNPISSCVNRGVSTRPGATNCSVSDACLIPGSTIAPRFGSVALGSFGH